MVRLLKWFLIGIFFIILEPSILLSEEVQAVDSLFFRSVSAYQQGDYAEALQLLELLNEVYPGHARTTATYLMQGKTLYKLHRYQEAQDIYNKIINQFPGSYYVDDAYYGLGTVFYRRQMYQDAVVQFLKIVDAEWDARLQVPAAQISSDIMDYLMNEEDLRALLDMVSGEKARAAVTIRLARRGLTQRHYQATKNLLESFLNTYPRSPYVDQVKKLLDQAYLLGETTFKVGVILPVADEDGKALLEGIQYAIDLHNAERKGTQVELVIRDSGTDIIQSIKMAQELCHDEEILTIIGGLESDITAAIAAVAQENGVVLLAPTATANDITSIGPAIFQLNNNLRVRSETLAEYAVTVLGLKRFAVLTTPDEYGKSMRDTFVETVNRLGGEIIFDKWYFEGAEDKNVYFETQFKAIREAGIKQMFQENNRRYINVSISDLVDSTEIPVTSIDGLFLPVYQDDLPYVIPQIASQNISAHVFGGATWHDIDMLEEQQKYIDQNYIDGVIFLSDYYINPSDYSYYLFRDAYQRKMGKFPEKMEVYGYDTANLLLSVVGEKSLPRQEIRNSLSQAKPFTGMRGVISFNEERVNTFVHILQYRGGTILQIK